MFIQRNLHMNLHSKIVCRVKKWKIPKVHQKMNKMSQTHTPENYWIKQKLLSLDVVAHAFKPSIQEAEAGGALRLRPDWFT